MDPQTLRVLKKKLLRMQHCEHVFFPRSLGLQETISESFRRRRQAKEGCPFNNENERERLRARQPPARLVVGCLRHITAKYRRDNKCAPRFCCADSKSNNDGRCIPIKIEMNKSPPSLLYLVIYNPELKPADDSAGDRDEDAEEQAHVLFYTGDNESALP